MNLLSNLKEYHKFFLDKDIGSILASNAQVGITLDPLEF